jgi:hypothetical protein
VARRPRYFLWTAASSPLKGAAGIVCDWTGKASTVHLLTEGSSLPLAFLVTASNADLISSPYLQLQIMSQSQKSSLICEKFQRPFGCRQSFQKRVPVLVMASD